MYGQCMGICNTFKEAPKLRHMFTQLRHGSHVTENGQTSNKPFNYDTDPEDSYIDVSEIPDHRQHHDNPGYMGEDQDLYLCPIDGTRGGGGRTGQPFENLKV